MLRSVIKQFTKHKTLLLYFPCTCIVKYCSYGGGDRETIQEFHRVRSSMTRARLDHVPAIPHDINDVSIRGLWKRTWSEDRSLGSCLMLFLRALRTLSCPITKSSSSCVWELSCRIWIFGFRSSRSKTFVCILALHSFLQIDVSGQYELMILGLH
jgi:hypothetical protein